MTEDWNNRETSLHDIRRATSQYEELQLVGRLIAAGWPSTEHNVPAMAHPYFSCNDESAVQHAFVFKGDQVVIPVTLRSQMIKRIHSSHLEIEGCLMRVREAVYRPGMNGMVRDFILSCSILQFYCYQSRAPNQFSLMRFRTGHGPK